MDRPDYYREAKAVAATLAGEGQPDAADSLLDAIASGFSASEILMTLRFRIHALMADNRKLSDATVARLRNLEEAITQALGD